MKSVNYLYKKRLVVYHCGTFEQVLIAGSFCEGMFVQNIRGQSFVKRPSDDGLLISGFVMMKYYSSWLLRNNSCHFLLTSGSCNFPDKAILPPVM